MSSQRLRISPVAFFSVGGDGVKIGLRARTDGMVVSSGVFALLARFADPVCVDDVIDGSGEEYASSARQLIDELVTFGVLTPEPGTADGETAVYPEEHHGRDALKQLDDIQVLLQHIVGDLHAMGPHRTIGAISSEIGLVLSDVLDIQSRVESALEEHTSRQMQALSIAEGSPLKLHLGSADKRIAGWVNIDIHPAELSLNIARPLPFEDRTVDFVYSAHTFEHLPYPDEAHRHLKDILRVLKRGGVARLVVPDIEALARAYVSGASDVFAAISGRVRDGAAFEAAPLEQFLAYAGAPVRVRDRWYDHKFGYDFSSLSAMFTRVGFQQVKRCSFMGSEYRELQIDDRSAGATISVGGECLSLFIEANA